MTKKRATWVMAILAVVLVLTLFTAAIGWGPTGSGSAKNIRLGLDLSGGVSITYQTVGDEEPSAEDMSDTIYKLQQRVQNYSTEASVYKEGANRINIEIPGVTDANAILEELGKPGSLTFTLADGTEVLNGTEVTSAEAGSQNDSLGNSEYVVSLTFSDAGKAAFAEATSANVGKQIYIVYDGEVISAPVVREAITDGKCVISGNFTIESASELASYIRIGSLSLELEEIRSNVVGAQLGEKALSSSLIAGIIGLCLVILLMIYVYKIPGIIAGAALVMYAGFELVALNAFDMTLTLAGIAGVILSIGMAVDANVIIYSRIREEISAGNSVRSSIDIGFKKALGAIIDGNVTTLIAAIVLNFMATGSVKGFAQTLGLGIIISMITACIISRLMVNAAYALGMKDEKYYGKAKEIKTIDFVGKRKLWFTIAIIAILLGPASMLINKGAGNGFLNLSMEFRGGTSTDVTFNDSYSIEEIDEKIKPVIRDVIGDAEVQAQKVSGGNEIIFKTRVLTLDERMELTDALDEKVGIAVYTTESGVDEKSISFETISSTISNEMRRDAVVAVIIAVILMLIYIWFRFSDIRFATSAVLALLHDVLVVFACYALIRISIGNTFIACMLTIVGYSINATIVIFDRIRENLKNRTKKDTLENIVNNSVTQTLTRSIYTSLTTFITIACLYILGVPSIKEFALPLMVGIIAGGYSSVFVTGCLWYMMRSAAEKKTAAASRKK
ncbi:MAG: protein translocase subunit SecD [Lachnospiraceae bacterium]|nr:protein translocase subunit SecD [Lachnospiraceae bacterium]